MGPLPKGNAKAILAAKLKEAAKKKAATKKPLTKAQEFKQDPEMAMKKYYTGGAGVKLPVERQPAYQKAKSQAAFNSSLVRGGTKNPLYDPSKNYPSMYGTKKTTSTKKK